MTVALSLLAALSYGLSDFIGGMASKRASAWSVALVAALTGGDAHAGGVAASRRRSGACGLLVGGGGRHRERLRHRIPLPRPVVRAGWGWSPPCPASGRP